MGPACVGGREDGDLGEVAMVATKAVHRRGLLVMVVVVVAVVTVVTVVVISDLTPNLAMRRLRQSPRQ